MTADPAAVTAGPLDRTEPAGSAPAIRSSAEDVLVAYWRGHDIPTDPVQVAADSVRVLAVADLLAPPPRPPIPRPSLGSPIAFAAAMLTACAAGRRADAERPVTSTRIGAAHRARLLADAVLLDQAARIVEGDHSPLYVLLPPQHWTTAMLATS